MTRQRAILVAIAVFAVLLLLLLFLPMRLALGWSALDARGVSARGAEGTVWAGRIDDLRFGEFSFGRVRAAMHFWPLLTGRTSFALSRPEEPGLPPMRAGLSTGADSFALSDAHATLGAGAVFAPLPVDRLEMQDLTVRFENGVCVEAEGGLRAFFLPQMAGATLPQDGLLGTARCDGPAVRFALTGASGQEQVDLRLFADGRYAARLRLTGDRADQADMLTGTGFRAVAGAYILEMEGRF